MNPAIDDTIHNIERLYQSVTGETPQTGDRPYAAIPPETDAQKHVEAQVDRLLEVVGHAFEGMAPVREWTPAVTVWETDREIVASLELAGVARDDVQVTARDRFIEVSGRRRPPWSNGNGRSRVRMSERPFGPFRRYFALPPGMTAEAVSAQWKDGVLELRVTRERGPGTNAQSISIKS